MSQDKSPEIRFQGYTDNWEQHKLGEILNEQVNRTADFESNPLYSLTIEKGITPKTERYERGFLVQKDEELFKIVRPEEFVTNPMNLRFGALGYNKNPYNVSVSGYYDVFSIDENQCSSFWYAYFKTSDTIKKFDDAATGSLIEKRRVKYSTLTTLDFDMPNAMEEKKKIGDFFSSIDEMIALHQRKYEVLVNIKASMQKKMFPKKPGEFPEIRFERFTEAWEKRKIEDLIIDIADGPFGSNLKAEHYTNEAEARIIQLSNIGDYGWKNENIRYTTFEHAKEIKRSIVEEGEVVMAKMMPAGLTIIRPNDDKMYVLSSDAVRIKLNNNVIDNGFFVCSTKCDMFLEQINNDVQGSTRTRTSISKIKRMEVLVPSVEEQKAISRFFGELNNLIGVQQQKIEKLNNVKKACMRKMFV